MKISPELIPHSEFHTGLWLLSPGKPGWYYFYKDQNHYIIKTKEFLKTVDPPLRRLVKFLHQKKIKTTPSCAGHSLSKRLMEKIYTLLEIDGDKIRNGGLKLKDVQTGKNYLYQNKKYILPWTRTVFIKKLMPYQHKGIIGLHLEKRRDAINAILNLKVEEAKLYIRGHILFISIKNIENNKKVWNTLTKKIMKILK
jgi:hypothetical protein